MIIHASKTAVTEVLEKAAEEFGITIPELRRQCPNRNRPRFVSARNRAAVRLRDLGLSYPEIAEVLGLASHHSAYYAVNLKRKKREKVCPHCGGAL